jgi:hypothetical protein
LLVCPVIPIAFVLVLVAQHHGYCSIMKIRHASSVAAILQVCFFVGLASINIGQAVATSTGGSPSDPRESDKADEHADLAEGIKQREVKEYHERLVSNYESAERAIKTEGTERQVSAFTEQG